MARFLPSDRTVRWLIIAAAIVGLLGALVPPIFENRARPLSTKEDFTVATDPTDVTVAEDEDGRPWRENIVKQHFESTRHTRTAKTDVDSVAKVQSETRTELDHREFASLESETNLNRESVYPQAGPTSSETLRTPWGTTEHAAFEREGMQYFFPSETEQRSYPYYDSVAQTSEPADFTGTERLNGVPTYMFRQTIEAHPLNETLNKPLHVSGPAKDFYSATERERYDYPADTTVALEPYYTVARTFWVEPTTGLIVNMDEDIDVVLATDRQQVAGFDDAALADARSNRPVFSAHLTWSEDSRTAALDRVARTVNFVKTLAVIGWLGKTAAVVLLASAAWVYYRRSDR